MKKIFAFLTIMAVMTLGLSNIVYAQGSAGSSETTEVSSTTTTSDVEVTKSFHQVLNNYHK